MSDQPPPRREPLRAERQSEPSSAPSGGDQPPGPGYWKASDGNWYPPQPPPGVAPSAPPAVHGQPYHPYQGHGRRAGKTRNPWGAWLLTLVSLGIYGLYWYYKVNEEAREYEPSVNVQPGIAVCALVFGGFTFGIATIVSLVKTGGRISQAQRASGTTARCSGGLGFLLALLLGTHVVYYQSQLNKIWDRHGNPPPGTPL